MCKLVLLWYPIYHGGFLYSLLFFVPLFFLMDDFKSPFLLSSSHIYFFICLICSVDIMTFLFHLLYSSVSEFPFGSFSWLISLLTFCLCIISLIFLTLYYNSISFLKTVILISSVKSKLPMTLASVTKRLCDLRWFHVSLIFHVLEVLYCCLHFWSSSYLFQPL